MKKEGEQYDQWRAKNKEIGSVPFSSDRKKMTTIIKWEEAKGKTVARVYVKGAAEIILDRCT